MAKIEVVHGDALEIIGVSSDLIFTDPPFEMSGADLKRAFEDTTCNHLVLICTMKQFSELIKCSDWVLNFDLVLNHVVPKKSKSIHQPNYTHSNVFYMSRKNSKSIFNRKLRERSDTFESNGYFPSIVQAPRDNLKEHGMSKNETAMVDILGCFELDKSCLLVEIDEGYYKKLEEGFRFLR